MAVMGFPSWVAELLRLEGLERGPGIAPGVGPQAGLDADVLQEGRRVPAVLDRDHREQDAPVPALFHHESVHPDPEERRIRKRDARAERRDVEVEVVGLVRLERREARVVEGRGHRHVGHGAGERALRVEPPDAAAQLPPAVQGDEGAPALGEAARLRQGRGRAEPEPGPDGGAGDPEEGAPSPPA